MNAHTTQNSWHQTTVHLSAFAGKKITKSRIVTDVATPPGSIWDNYFPDIATYSHPPA